MYDGYEDQRARSLISALDIIGRGQAEVREAMEDSALHGAVSTIHQYVEAELIKLGYTDRCERERVIKQSLSPILSSFEDMDKLKEWCRLAMNNDLYDGA